MPFCPATQARIDLTSIMDPSLLHTRRAQVCHAHRCCIRWRRRFCERVGKRLLHQSGRVRQHACFRQLPDRKIDLFGSVAYSFAPQCRQTASGEDQNAQSSKKCHVFSFFLTAIRHAGSCTKRTTMPSGGRHLFGNAKSLGFSRLPSELILLRGGTPGMRCRGVGSCPNIGS